ncbi:hypothetical protein CLNEO_29610 [Anaerotignum neopropionicum]|uniref:Uncharacterized protein n=1 Tax=Anaerotignum neopropionicum TaxID=36847 RepID=A0A136WAY0_9FIRM|nr:hypothetical protein [Anaerotignum neopropionicum]KXL51675.1 hypothetical protein CLNEO_29610 [Anaerotignum neopropionicum]
MQNPNVKYIKMPSGYFCFFYRENYALFLRTQTSTGWSVPIILAERTASAFSICQFGELCYVLYSTMDGKLFIASSKDFINWEHRPLMSGAPNSMKTKFFMIPNEDAFHIIYHLPSETPGIETLVYSAFRNGQWEPPYQIDRFVPFDKTSFLARRISKEHIILYYRTAKSTWCAREILLSPFTIGSLAPMIQTSANFVDLSIVNDAERIHIIYIVRGMFRSQVVYQYKKTSAISTPRILWEDNNCDNCLVFMENERLVLMWTVNGRPLRCISENNGTTFGPVERYTGNFPALCTKGELLGAEGVALNAMETYGDLSKNLAPFLTTNKIKALPQSKALSFESEIRSQTPNLEKYPSPQAPYFEQAAQSPPPFYEKENQQQASYFEKENQGQMSYFENDNWAQTTFFQQQQQPLQSHPFSQETKTQSNQMTDAMPQQNAQQKQIDELSSLLSQRSDEIASNNARWKAQVTQLEAELSALRQENEKLKKTISVHQVQVQHSQIQLQKQENKIIQAAENIPSQPQEVHTNITTEVDHQTEEATPSTE